MKRVLSALLSVAYPVILLVILRRFAASIPAYASLGLKLYPVAVSAVIFSVFFRSLFADQTFIEKMARLQDGDLSPAKVAYTRKVTQVWCVFLALNGLTALFLAMFASVELWAAYTGVIAYVLMGILFGVELIIRRRVQHAKP